MNELEALQAEISGKIADFKAIGEKLADPSYEATADDRSRFDELDREIAAGREKIDGIRAKMETDSERAARMNRVKDVASWEEKIKETAFRRPNQDSDFRGNEANNDMAIALSAWHRLGHGSPEQPTAIEVAAGRRLGINIASGRFEVTNRDVLRAQARNLRDFYRGLNSSGASDARVEFDDGFHAAETDGLDSRVPERAGYTNRPVEFLNTLEMNMVAYGGILRAPVTIMITDHYEDVVETYGDDTTHTGRQIGEGQTIGTTLTPSFANLTFKAWDFTSDDIPVTNRQLERSRFALPSYIAVMLGERLGRIQGSTLTTGTGANTPYGLLTACTDGGSYVTSATSPTVVYNDLVDLQHKLDPVYWNAPGCGFMAHPTMLPYLKKIKDGQGLPILDLGKEGSRTKTLLGDPIYWNNSMTSTTAGAWVSGDKAIIWGMFPRYVVRRAGGGMPRLIRDETTNRRTDGTIFTALINFDGKLRDYGANPFAELRVL